MFYKIKKKLKISSYIDHYCNLLLVRFFLYFSEYSTFGAISNNTHDYTLSVRMQSVCVLDFGQCFIINLFCWTQKNLVKKRQKRKKY